MESLVIYMTGIIFVFGMFAWRVPHENLRTVFALGLIWPLSILFTLVIIMLDTVRWKVDVVNSEKRFGFRRPTNPKARGFAVTIFGEEVQFYKAG